MFSVYLPMFLMLGIAATVAFSVYGLTTALGPKNMTAEKAIPYEAGSETTGARHIRLSIKFYLTAILFVVFDIEAVFLYPWASLFETLGWFGFVEMVLFLLVLGVTLAYAWRKGALEWES
ncbi:MAG: NADH-quinone oxidoreductase subunit A [Myxococcota bacterium]